MSLCDSCDLLRGKCTKYDKPVQYEVSFSSGIERSCVLRCAQCLREYTTKEEG